MAWIDVLGIYLVTGAIIQGFGWLARKGWEASGKTEPIHGKWGRLAIWLGTIFGVLFWPVVLVALAIGWRMRRRTRRMERFLGFCEHATPWEPYCGACRRDVKREDVEQRTKIGSIQEIQASMDRLSQKAVATYLEAHSICPGCGKTGTLAQYLGSIWVKCSECGRRVFTPDPSMPEELDTVPGWPAEGVIAKAESFYDCSECEERYEGIPPGARADGRPLCVRCKVAHLRTKR